MTDIQRKLGIRVEEDEDEKDLEVRTPALLEDYKRWTLCFYPVGNVSVD